MKPFEHFTPDTLEEAISLLKEYNGKAKLIAGGTVLIPALKEEIYPEYPKALINIKEIPGLSFIEEEEETIKIGALTRLEEIVRSGKLEKYPLLKKAASSVGTPQIRNMGTIGGNLCQDVRCWYYWYPHRIGGRLTCYLKGGDICYALIGENHYHSIFGSYKYPDRPSPCQNACPAHTDIPSILEKLREGRIDEAARILLETNPLSPISGRICPHFCEDRCSRKMLDEPLAIREVERFLGDYILENFSKLLPSPDKKSGKKVAIVGSGPAGLTAAYYLKKSGHQVVIFERKNEPGGLLRYGIPPSQLDKEIVKKLIKTLENHLGLEFKLKIQLGKDVNLEDLSAQYDAVLLATGAPRKKETFTQYKTVLSNEKNLREKKRPSSHHVEKNVFAAGDLVNGPSTVVEAIASAKMAVALINRFLLGELAQESPSSQKVLYPVNVKAFKRMGRFGDFKREAERCFNCGCVAVNPSDMAVALMALGAKLKILSPNGTRVIPIEEFFTSVRGDLASDEILTEILIPKEVSNLPQVFLKFRLRNAVDFSIVSVGVWAELKGNVVKKIRIALGGAAPVPLRVREVESWLEGKKLEDQLIEEAAKMAVKEALPLPKNAYKVEITKVMLKRALASFKGN
jgi:CO/xanthine dehydrogenase FAD-binding subunit